MGSIQETIKELEALPISDQEAIGEIVHSRYLRIAKDIPPKVEKSTRWARMADNIPGTLNGVGKHLRDSSKEFRETFSITNEK